MSKEQILSRVRDAAAPVAASMGLLVWGVELVGSGRPLIRVFVDCARDGGAPADPVSSGSSGSPASSGFGPSSPFAGRPDALPVPPLADDAAEEGGGSPGSSGVTIGQCSDLSRLLGLALDVEDMFQDAWELEVSSPGLERVFFDPGQMSPYLGRDIDLTLWEDVPECAGRRRFRGVLSGLEGDAFTLSIADLPGKPGMTELAFSWPKVRKARLVHIFPDTSKPGSGKEAKSPKAGKEGGGKRL